MKNSKFTLVVLMTFLIGAYVYYLKYTNNSKRKENSEKYIGYFVNVFKNPVEYSCLNKRYPIPESGEFKCSSFPIAFYMNSIKLGEITSIHSDGYVFPQDIIVVDDLNRLKKSGFILALR